MQPGHDIFSDPFRKPNQNLLLQDITCFLPDMVVVLQLIRVNHQSKLLHHLIPESVTSRMQASEYASLMFSCCDFQRVLLKVYWQAKWFLWCIKSNVQDCYTLCECFFQNLSAKPLWGYSSFRNMKRRRDSSLPSLFCYLPGSEERGNPFRGLNHKLAKTEKCKCTVSEFETFLSLLNSAIGCCWLRPCSGAVFHLLLVENIFFFWGLNSCCNMQMLTQIH